MSDDDQGAAPAGEAEPAGRAWHPSRRPDYRLDHRAPPSGRIVERARSRGWLRNLADLLRRPAVKVAIAVGLFVLAAIIFDATINGGSWTERPPKPKATQKAPRG